jgi:tripartite-type tricarboxylate transporter receptor subunit TctC
MKHWIQCAVAAAALATLVVAGPALAQKDYPTKPVKMIVPFPPGGGTDIIARVLTDKLSTTLGWKMVVDNKPGAGGTLGMDAAAKSKADGYTVVLGQTANLSIASSLYPGLGYDPIKSFAPVTLVDSAPLVVIVGANSPYKALGDVVAAAKAAPGKLLFASPGNGTVAHLAGELFQQTAQVKYTHVPYKGAAQALPDLISGRAAFFISSLETALPQIKSNQVRALAVTSAKRSAALPNVQTFAEAGFKGSEAETWFGVLVPAGTPEPIVARLNAEITKILQSPEVKERLGGDVQTGPAEFSKVIKSDQEKWAKIIKDAGVKSE